MHCKTAVAFITLVCSACYVATPEIGTDLLPSPTTSGTSGGTSGSTGASSNRLTGCGGGGTTGGGSSPPSCGFQVGCYLTSCTEGSCQCIISGEVASTLADAGVDCQHAAWIACGFPADPDRGVP